MGKIRYLEKLFEDCLIKFKNDKDFQYEDTWVKNKCVDYITDYFIAFNNKFHDSNVKTIAATSKRNLDIVRRYSCSYENNIGKNHETRYINIEVSQSQLLLVLRYFEARVYVDLSCKLKYIISQLKRGNDRIKIEEIGGLGDLNIDVRTYNSIMRYYQSCYVLNDFTKLTTSQLENINGLGKLGCEQLIKEINLLGYKFSNQLSLDKDDTQEEIVLPDYRDIIVPCELTNVIAKLRSIKSRELTLLNLSDAINDLKEVSKFLDLLIEHLEKQRDDNYGSASK